MIKINNNTTQENINTQIKNSNEKFISAVKGDKIPQMKLKNKRDASEFSYKNLELAIQYVIED